MRISDWSSDVCSSDLRNGERHLRTRRALGNIYSRVAGGQVLLAAALGLARRCTFNLREVKYDYPAELVPKGETPASHLRKLTETGTRRRWPAGAPAQVVKQIEDELALMAELGYAAFFPKHHRSAKRRVRNRRGLTQTNPM